MGAVAIDTKKKEREYKHLTLSDRAVVKYLILHRSKVDVSYGANTNININQAGDTFEFNQELICLYASLDIALANISLKDKEQKFLELIFEGNTVADLIEHYKFPKKTAYRILGRVIDKVVEKNDNDWLEVMKNQGLVRISK